MAEKVGFQFTGIVIQPATVFGHNLAFGSPANGRIVYDLSSAGTHEPGRGDSKGFRQLIFGGLALNIAGVNFRADDYVAAVFNDDASSQGADILETYFTSGLNPPLEKPLIVDGVPHTTGLLDVAFRNPSGTAFSEPKLPNDLPPDLFSDHFALISDTTDDPFDDVLVVISNFSRLAAIDGDFDFDIDVDGDDFLIWQQTLGSSTDLAADANGNDLVDSDDLSFWRTHFGDGSLSVVAVPEPATCHLMILWVLAAAATSARMALFGRLR